uniref:sugar transferase n=1 Tax=Streptomyces sp. SM12 TaxID=1071602 RepID=UPI0015E1A2D9
LGLLVGAIGVGTGTALASALRGHPEYGMRPVALVMPQDRPPTVPAPASPAAPDTTEAGASLPVLGTPDEVARAIVQNTVVDAVFVRGPGEREDAELLRLCRDQGCTVWLVDVGPELGPVPVPGVVLGRRPDQTAHLWGFACWRLDPPRETAAPHLAKRCLDVLVAALALLLASPVLLACALAVRIADGPGVLFRQQRVGQGGRPFVILKFRTLRPVDDAESATRWNVAGDRRMSPVGALLRRSSLDELPQLWNVLRGDMSLVGPRPERPHFVAEFSRTYPGYEQRHRMPVGLTGLAQVSGLRGDTSIEERTRFDNHYIDTWSLWQDISIMLRTSVGCFRCGGS